MTFALEINLPLLIKMFGIILIISIYCSFIMNTTVIISLGINLFTFFALCSLYDFEIGLCRSIKNNFDSCILDGCYLHYLSKMEKK